ncbi:MAG: nucleoside hydrolase [Traorella sp.]
MRKVIIDCDPGHDDIMAILCALAHPMEIEILGYTTVCGNQTLDKVTNNLTSVLSMIKKEGKVAKGYDEPLIYPKDPQPAAHGESGLDGPVLQKSTFEPIKKHAIEFMRDCIEENDEVTIIALAPLTNVAMFLKTYPYLKKKIKEITLMGGSIYAGNILPRAEFNLYEDAHAADIVFKSGVNITMAPIEVCNTTAIYHHEIDNLKNKGYVSQLSHDILQFFSLYNRKRNIDRSPIFDLVPVMELLHPELFVSQMSHVDIEVSGRYTRGMSIVTKDDLGNIKVLLSGNRDLMIQYFLDDLSKLDLEYEK